MVGVEFRDRERLWASLLTAESASGKTHALNASRASTVTTDHNCGSLCSNTGRKARCEHWNSHAQNVNHA